MNGRVEQHRSSSDSLTTSPTLISGLRARHPEAWQRLVQIYAPLVYYWCRQAGINSHDSADVVQEVFQAVVVGVDGFRHDRPGDTFRGWLRTIFRHTVGRHWRRHGGAPHARGGTTALEQIQNCPDEPRTQDDDLDSAAISEVFHRALDLIRAELEESTWRAFWEATVEERAPCEVAESLGMSPGAVRTAKWRVLRRLRQTLGDIE